MTTIISASTNTHPTTGSISTAAPGDVRLAGRDHAVDDARADPGDRDGSTPATTVTKPRNMASFDRVPHQLQRAPAVVEHAKEAVDRNSGIR